MVNCINWVISSPVYCKDLIEVIFTIFEITAFHILCLKQVKFYIKGTEGTKYTPDEFKQRWGQAFPLGV